MANTANAIWQGSGPAFTFQQVAFGGKDAAEMAYRGRATFTGDASTATVTISFIDGTQTPFSTPGNPPTAVAPTTVMATAGSNGSTNAGTWSSTVYIVGVTSITTTGFVVTASANFAATSYTIDFIVIP
jgi:hypothetical protein